MNKIEIAAYHPITHFYPFTSTEYLLWAKNSRELDREEVEALKDTWMTRGQTEEGRDFLGLFPLSEKPFTPLWCDKLLLPLKSNSSLSSLMDIPGCPPDGANYQLILLLLLLLWPCIFVHFSPITCYQRALTVCVSVSSPRNHGDQSSLHTRRALR